MKTRISSFIDNGYKVIFVVDYDDSESFVRNLNSIKLLELR
jgi:hypothetical protein